MKYLAWLVAVSVILAGILGLVAPERALALRSIATTQAGLLAIAVVRILIGIVLIMTAPASRAPKILQAAGGLVLLAGLVTPLVGVERVKAIIDWEAAQGPGLIRFAAIVVTTIGVGLAAALTPRKHAGAPPIS